jgi:hypothetical protein
LEETLSANTPSALPYASLAVLSENLRTISGKSNTHKGVLTLCEEKFLTFVRKMDHYFDLIAMFIPRNFDWRCKFWELIYVVFKVLLL